MFAHVDAGTQQATDESMKTVLTQDHFYSTDGSMMALMEQCVMSLTTLDISFCRNVPRMRSVFGRRDWKATDAGSLRLHTAFFSSRSFGYCASCLTKCFVYTTYTRRAQPAFLRVILKTSLVVPYWQSSWSDTSRRGFNKMDTFSCSILVHRCNSCGCLQDDNPNTASVFKIGLFLFFLRPRALPLLPLHEIWPAKLLRHQARLFFGSKKELIYNRAGSHTSELY